MVVNKKNVFIFILIVSLLYLAFLFMIVPWNEELTIKRVLISFLIDLPCWILLGSIEYFILKKLREKVKWKSQILQVAVTLLIFNLLIIVLATIVDYLIFTPKSLDYLAGAAIPIIVINSTILFLLEFFTYNQKQEVTKQKLAIAEKERLQYQYETLKAQVNPHFLFNSLNVLSSLVYHDAEKANNFTKKMSGVYRYLLFTNSRSTVTVKEEIDFLEAYLYLEKIRFEDTFQLEIICEDNSLLSKNIIPISLQILTENILKHNISTKSQPLQVNILIENEGITVSNNIQLRSSVEKGGLGLSNLQKQYSLHGKSLLISESNTAFNVKIPYL